MKRKKILAGLFAIALIGSISLTTVSAQTSNAGGEEGGNYNVGGQSLTGDASHFAINFGGNGGYRLYLVPMDKLAYANKGVVTSDNSDITISATKTVTEEGVCILNRYKKYALYEFIADNSGSYSGSLSYKINAGREKARYLSYAGGDEYRMVEIDPSYILSRGKGINRNKGTNSFYFEEVIGKHGSTEILTSWAENDGAEFGKGKYNFDQLAKWANTVFTQDKGEDFYNSVMDNYKSALGDNADSIWKEMNYPNTYEDWQTGKWTVIVEPVYITKKGSGSVLVISYQDFLGSYADDELSGSTEKGIVARSKRVPDTNRSYPKSNTFTNIFAPSLEMLKWSRESHISPDTPMLYYRRGAWGTTTYMFGKMKNYYTEFKDVEVYNSEGIAERTNISTKDSPYLAGFSYNSNIADLFKPASRNLKGLETYVLSTDSLKPDEVTTVDIDFRKVAVSGNVKDVSDDWGIPQIKKGTINLITSTEDRGWNINKNTIKNKSDAVSDDVYGAIANFWGAETQDKIASDNYYLRSYSVSTRDFGSGTFDLADMTTDMSSGLKIQTTVNAGLTSIGTDPKDSTDYTLGCLYSTKLVGDDSVKFESSASSTTIKSVASQYDAVKSQMIKGGTYGTFDSKDKQINTLNNAGISGLSNSTLNNITTTDSGASLKTKNSDVAKTTVAVATVLPKVEVTSTISYAERNEDGEVMLNHWLGEDKATESRTYQVVDAVYDDSNITTRLARIKPSEKFKSASGFAIAYPKGSNFDNSNEFFNTFYGKLKDSSGMDSYAEVVRVLREMGIDAEIFPLSDTDDVDLFLGATEDLKGDFVGYNINVISDSKTTKIESVDAVLKPYELNFIYPSTSMNNPQLERLWAYAIKGATPYNLMRSQTHGGDIINFNNTHRNALLTYVDRKGNLSLGHASDSSITVEYVEGKNYMGGKYTEWIPLANTFENCYTYYLDYALNLSRGIYDNNFVVSSISVPDDSIDNDYLTRMGIIKGNKPKGYSNDYVGTVTIGTTKDKFRWTTDTNTVYTITVGGKKIQYPMNPFSVRPTSEGVGFDLNTKGYMYLPHNLATAEPKPKDGRKVFMGDSGSLGLDITGKVLKFYPEYTMLAYNVKDNGLTDEGVIKSDDYSLETVESDIKVMGTKERTVKASSLYCISADKVTSSDVKLYSSAEAKTADAKALSSAFGGEPVIYAGGDIDFKANIDNIELVGYSLDLIDRNIDGATIGGKTNKLYYGDNDNATYNSVIADGSDIKSEWGNSYNPVEEYNKWVTDMKNNLKVDLTMSEERDTDTYSATMRTSYSTVDITTSPTVISYALTFNKNGLVEDGSYKALIKSMANRLGCSEDGAKKYLYDSGMIQSIQDALEDSGDAINDSEVVKVDNIYDNEKWYSETTKTFVIREYISTAKVSNINCSDKVDYGWAYDGGGSLFNDGYECSFNFTIGVKDPVKAFTTSDVLVKSTPINGGKFVVSNATTSDMKY